MQVAAALVKHCTPFNTLDFDFCKANSIQSRGFTIHRSSKLPRHFRHSCSMDRKLSLTARRPGRIAASTSTVHATFCSCCTFPEISLSTRASRRLGPSLQGTATASDCCCWPPTTPLPAHSTSSGLWPTDGDGTQPPPKRRFGHARDCTPVL